MRCGLLFGLAAVIAGCTSIEKLNPFGGEKPTNKQIGESGFVQGFLGGVVADEPQAAIIGREVLSSGGSAGDAAAAMYFALAVTKPTEAGLTGGGQCVLRAAGGRIMETINFPTVLPEAGGSVAVPGNPRGIAVVHARSGRLPWAQVIQPAENLARFGSVVSRAFATDLRAHAGYLTAHPETANLFRKGNSQQLVAEGDRVNRPGVAGVLGRLRARGVGDFYQGQLAHDFIADANRQGGKLTHEAMRAYLPKVSGTITVPYVEQAVLHLPEPPGPGGMMAAELASVLMKAGRSSVPKDDLLPHLLAEASAATAVQRFDWLTADGAIRRPAPGLDGATAEKIAGGLDKARHKPVGGAPVLELRDGRSATGFVAVDKEGGAVACTVSMNRPFGAALLAPSLGLLLAAPPGADANPAMNATPVLLVSVGRKDFRTAERLFLAATVTGGPGAATALVDTIIRVSALGQELESVVAAPRIYHPGSPDLVIVEPGLPADLVNGLRDRGHQMREMPTDTRLNVIYCETGVPAKAQVCGAKSDPRGYGLGAVGDV